MLVGNFNQSRISSIPKVPNPELTLEIIGIFLKFVFSEISFTYSLLSEKNFL